MKAVSISLVLISPGKAFKNVQIWVWVVPIKFHSCSLNLTVEENLYLAGSGGATKSFRFFRPWKKYKSERDWVREVTDQVGLDAYTFFKSV